jgi:NAD(P)H-nitrite reductase large subunit
MIHYQYLIIGGGMTGDAAVRGIRQTDAEGSIGLISRESYPPYNRPPLSKGLWSGKSEDTIWRRVEDFDVTLHLGRRVVSMEVEDRMVIDHQGTKYSYRKLLLATGGSAIKLSFGGDDIIYFRTLDDYRRVRDLADTKKRFAVIGGGFVGSEIAAALAQNGNEVVMIFPENGICGRIFPEDIAHYLNRDFEGKGIKILSNRFVTGMEKRGPVFILQTEVATNPRTERYTQTYTEEVAAAGLAVNKGVLVDKYLQTSQPDVYAAGDVAEFYNSALDKRIIVEHEENANMSGFLAGQAMAGNPQEYDYLPYFYSKLFEVYYEGVGEMSAALYTVQDMKEPFQKGVIYYLAENRVRGVLFWNMRRKLNDARKLISEPGPLTRENLIGRIS